MTTMRAKYPGRCRACGRDIEVGEDIDWSKGTGARHASCVRGSTPSVHRPCPMRREPPKPSHEKGDPAALAAKAGVQLVGTARVSVSYGGRVGLGEIVQHRGKSHIVVEVNNYHVSRQEAEEEREALEDQDYFDAAERVKSGPKADAMLIECTDSPGIAEEKAKEQAAARAAQAEKDARETEFAAVQASIPTGYVSTEYLDLDPLKLAWVKVHDGRIGDKYGHGTLWSRATLPDGRPVWKLDSSQYDDYRTSYIVPPDYPGLDPKHVFPVKKQDN